MKKLVLFVAAGLLTVSTAMSQAKKVVECESFESVDLDGNIRIFIEQGPEPVAEIEAKKDRYLDEYRIEVRNGTLYIQHDEDGFSSAPKLHVYLTHPNLRELDMDGLIYVGSHDPIESESLRIKGDGLIKGDIEVDVKHLKIDLDGLCRLTVSGKADRSHMRLDGLGKINARELDCNDINKSADGLASIRVGG